MIWLMICATVIVAAGVVIYRAICTLHHLHWRRVGMTYPQFAALGLSHVILAVGSLIALIEAASGSVSFPALVVVVGVAGLFVFDRRAAL